MERGLRRQARKSASNHYQHEFAVAIVRRSILESSLIISEKHANINLEKQITKMRILLHFRENGNFVPSKQYFSKEKAPW